MVAPPVLSLCGEMATSSIIRGRTVQSTALQVGKVQLNAGQSVNLHELSFCEVPANSPPCGENKLSVGYEVDADNNFAGCYMGQGMAWRVGSGRRLQRPAGGSSARRAATAPPGVAGAVHLARGRCRHAGSWCGDRQRIRVANADTNQSAASPHSTGSDASSSCRWPPQRHEPPGRKWFDGDNHRNRSPETGDERRGGTQQLQPTVASAAVLALHTPPTATVTTASTSSSSPSALAAGIAAAVEPLSHIALGQARQRQPGPRFPQRRRLRPRRPRPRRSLQHRARQRRRRHVVALPFAPIAKIIVGLLAVAGWDQHLRPAPDQPHLAVPVLDS